MNWTQESLCIMNIYVDDQCMNGRVHAGHAHSERVTSVSQGVIRTWCIQTHMYTRNE